MIAHRKHGKKDSSCHWEEQDQITEPIKGSSGRCKKPGTITESATLLKIKKCLGQIVRDCVQAIQTAKKT